MSAKIDEAKRESEAIRSDISVLNTRLDRIKAAREEEEAKLTQIRQSEMDARSDIPALNVEKKELWEVGLGGLHASGNRTGWVMLKACSSNQQERPPCALVATAMDGQTRCQHLARSGVWM